MELFLILGGILVVAYLIFDHRKKPGGGTACRIINYAFFALVYLTFSPNTSVAEPQNGIVVCPALGVSVGDISKVMALGDSLEVWRSSNSNIENIISYPVPLRQSHYAIGLGSLDGLIFFDRDIKSTEYGSTGITGDYVLGLGHPEDLEYLGPCELVLPHNTCAHPDNISLSISCTTNAVADLSSCKISDNSMQINGRSQYDVIISLLHFEAPSAVERGFRDCFERGTITANYSPTGTTDSLLHMAADANKIGLVSLLIAQGADVNAIGFFGETAIFGSSIEVGKVLIESGIDLNVLDSSRDTWPNTVANKISRHDNGENDLGNSYEKYIAWAEYLRDLQ